MAPGFGRRRAALAMGAPEAWGAAEPGAARVAGGSGRRRLSPRRARRAPHHVGRPLHVPDPARWAQPAHRSDLEPARFAGAVGWAGAPGAAGAAVRPAAAGGRGPGVPRPLRPPGPAHGSAAAANVRRRAALGHAARVPAVAGPDRRAERGGTGLVAVDVDRTAGRRAPGHRAPGPALVPPQPGRRRPAPVGILRRGDAGRLPTL